MKWEGTFKDEFYFKKTREKNVKKKYRFNHSLRVVF